MKDPVAHAKAEEELARLLLEKDLYYLGLAWPQILGTKKACRKRPA